MRNCDRAPVITIEGPEKSKEERIQLAVDARYAGKGAISQRAAARQFGVESSTVNDRIKRKARPAIQFHQDRQALHPAEEASFAEWIRKMQRWNWPTRVEQVRYMAEEILKENGSGIQMLSLDWPMRFVKRHPDLKTKFVPPIDKDRVLAQDPRFLAHWFQLYQELCLEHSIKTENQYNMDEKGFMAGVTGKVKVMISKYEKKEHTSQPGSREWVTLIECISQSGQALPPYMIFKAKHFQNTWFKALNGQKGYISVSDNGWTSNEIGLKWLTDCFHPNTVNEGTQERGEYRLLCLDGHASHISSRVLEFALKERIILLCLPPHSTHILQPLDIGVFCPLAVNYRNTVMAACDMDRHYSVRKEEFIKHYMTARQMTFTPEIITSAWRKSGLLPYNPDVILCDFPGLGDGARQGDIVLTLRPTTPPETIISYTNEQGVQMKKLLTPANTKEIRQLLHEIGKTVDPGILQAIDKVGKRAIHSLSSLQIERTTNTRLLELENQRHQQQKVKRSRIHFGGEGQAVVLTQQILDERRNRLKILTAKQQAALDTKQRATFRRELLCKINEYIFYSPPPKPPKKKSTKTPTKTPTKKVQFNPITPSYYDESILPAEFFRSIEVEQELGQELEQTPGYQGSILY